MDLLSRARSMILRPALFATLAALHLTTACAGSSAPVAADAGDAADAGGDAAPSGAVGAACIPSPELSASFASFREEEVTLDANNAACGGLVCLVNHFRGRVSCPYGQDTSGKSFPPAAPCVVPGTSTPVTPNDPKAGQAISSQCTDRAAGKTVSCTCRCANPEGKSDDGASYCACPSGYQCSQVVPALVAGDPRAGAYCIPSGTAYDRSNACSNVCSPGTDPCPDPSAAIPLSPQGSPTTYTITGLRLQSGLCLPMSLATDASGRAKCDVFYVLANGDSCAAHPGLTDAAPDVATALRTFDQLAASQAVCTLAQLVGPCDTSSQAGWCYVTAPSAPNGCAQTILVSPTGMLPSGAGANLGCP